MNTSNNRLYDPLQLCKAVCENNDKTFRELFKGKINGSFLVKIKGEILRRLGMGFLKYFPIQLDNTKIMTGTGEAAEYDICRMIVGVHRHYSIFLTEDEIRRNQKDRDYQERITNEVIEKTRFRQYGSMFFRREQLLSGDEFLYFPVPYELFVMCMRAFGLMNGKSEPLFFYYGDLLGYALSALTLMENNFLSSAYPLCRSMIELYLKILILKKHPTASTDYKKFCGFEIDQSCCSQKYPDEFIAIYINRKFLPANSKSNYLHFGWLDCIESYDTKRSNRYSIYGILEYLMNDDGQKDELTHLRFFYKMCHGYAHGSTIHVKYPLLQYFEISSMIFYVIRPVFTDICQTISFPVSDEDRFLLTVLDRDFQKLNEQYQKKSTENFELYYKSC